jgi:hypothetical protein
MELQHADSSTSTSDGDLETNSTMSSPQTFDPPEDATRRVHFADEVPNGELEERFEVAPFEQWSGSANADDPDVDRESADVIWQFASSDEWQQQQQQQQQRQQQQELKQHFKKPDELRPVELDGSLMAVAEEQGLPSVGSILHREGSCRSCTACVWIFKPQGCSNGKACRHCHLCSFEEMKMRKRMYKANRKKASKI